MCMCVDRYQIAHTMVRGRIYFTLKDETNQIKCIIWQNNAARFRALIRHGEEVQVQGKIGGLWASGDIPDYGESGETVGSRCVATGF